MRLTTTGVAFLLTQLVAAAFTPSVESLGAGAVTQTSVVLKASLNTHGLNSWAFFQWGTTTNYGKTTATNGAAFPEVSREEAVVLDHLTPNLTYHYRAVGFNEDGIAYGADRVFTTLPPLPVATTLPATAVSVFSATLSGSATAQGNVVAFFQWGATTAYDKATTNLSAKPGYSVPIANLAPLTTYHYRLVVMNESGAAYGADRVFTTAGLAPMVSTMSATNIAQTAATLAGRVSPSSLITTVYFRWGPSPAYGNTTTGLLLGNEPAAADLGLNVSGLAPDTTYHYQCVASNAAGVVYGRNVTFTTRPSLPAALSLPAADVTEYSANLRGQVNPNGPYPTAYCFQWGTSTLYGNRSPWVTLPPGIEFAPVDRPLANLSRLTTYHFQIIASNAAGVYFANDQVFTTCGWSPATVTGPATNVLLTAGTITGQAIPNNLVTTALFKWGSTTKYTGTAPVPPVAIPGTIGTNSSPMKATLKLSADLAYHYQAAAFSGGGSAFGIDRTMRPVLVPPYAETLPATEIGFSDATLNGRVGPQGLDTSFYFEWGTNTAYGKTTPIQSAGNSLNTNAVLQALDGLQFVTTYHYRIVAFSKGGTNRGKDVYFTTTAPSPSVSTRDLNTVTANSAVLLGSVNNFGLPATYFFSWGTNTNALTKTAARALTASRSNQDVSLTLTGLQPGTQYYFVVTAESDAGQSVSKPFRPFTTPSLAARAIKSPGGNPMPVVTVSADNGSVTISWSSLIGTTYRVYSKDELGAGVWSSLGTLTATNSVSSVTDPVKAGGQRIYKVVSDPVQPEQQAPSLR